MLPNRVWISQNRIGLRWFSSDPIYTEYVRADIYEKLVAAAKQVIDEIEPHGHWHCVDALKKALEE
uniref:Uncharacterized protein n=1 Tax=viral metagenome TaxID=1070528 RepID=A0A6H1ZKW7_9ZZZZ